MIDDPLKKMWYVSTMKYYLAIRKDEILPFAITWVYLQNIKLSKVRQKKLRNI